LKYFLTFTPLKNVIAILFFTIYLLSATELSQLLKLPAFVAHFKEHKKEKNNLTLWQFLCIHYANNNKPDADHAKDMQLPFKAHDNCGAQISVAFLPAFYTIATHKLHHTEPVKQYFTDDIFVSSSFLSNIWQPPKSC
jgi:hypothetical protein